MPATPAPFSVTTIGAAVNRLPNLYSRVGELGVFGAPRGVPTTNVTVLRRNNRVTLLSSVSRQGPGQRLNRARDSFVTFDVPTFKTEDTLTPSDIQGFTAFQPGPEQLRSMAEAYNRRLLETRQPHDETHEFLRMSALKGVVMDPGTGDEMYDLFDEFGIAKKIIYFDLDNANSDIFAKIEELEDHIATNLNGDVTTGPRVLAAADFVRKIKRHPKYEVYLEGHAAALNQIAMSRATAGNPNAQRQVILENTIFESYTGQGVRADGSTVDYIDAGKGHAFPEGTINTFQEYDAPPERMSAVNLAPTQSIHVYAEELSRDRGVEMDVESCKIPLCNRPEVLVEVRAGAAP